MPFTPFHLGPALFFGIPLRKYLHAPTFILANVILDVEPFLVLVTGASYPLHGYFHTFIAAVGVGLVLGFAAFIFEKRLQPFYKTLLFETGKPMEKHKFLLAGVFGTSLHVLFDAPLYVDIEPFYPVEANPLYGLVSSSAVYQLCVWMGILGITFYALLFAVDMYRRSRAKSCASHSLNTQEA